MYGLTRAGWLEDIARRKSAQAQADSGEVRFRYGLGPTAAQMLGWDATNAFARFCQWSTNLKPDTNPHLQPHEMKGQTVGDPSLPQT